MGFGLKLGLAALVLTGAVAITGPAAAQPRPGGFGAGGFGARGFGRPAFLHGPLGPHRPGFAQGPAQGRFMRRFSAANLTHDGRLTLDQARAANMTVLARHFNEIDTAHHGYVTMDDIRAFRAKVRARRAAAQGDDGFGPPPGSSPPP